MPFLSGMSLDCYANFTLQVYQQYKLKPKKQTDREDLEDPEPGTPAARMGASRNMARPTKREQSFRGRQHICIRLC
jgi:hypothetical protein